MLLTVLRLLNKTIVIVVAMFNFKDIFQYPGSRFDDHNCPNSENQAKCLANQLFEETPECGGVNIEGDLIYFDNAFGRGGDCAPIIADDFRSRTTYSR